MVVTHESEKEAVKAPKPRKKGKAKQAEPVPAAEEAPLAEPQAAEQPSQPEPATPAPRKGSKKRRAKSSEPVTLGELSERYLKHLEQEGKSHGTLFSYGMEMKTACRELGERTLVHKLAVSQVAAFFESPRVTRLKSGKPKAKPSIDKTRRVLRLALVWAVEQGWIPEAPLPKSE